MCVRTYVRMCPYINKAGVYTLYVCRVSYTVYTVHTELRARAGQCRARTRDARRINRSRVLISRRGGERRSYGPLRPFARVTVAARTERSGAFRRRVRSTCPPSYPARPPGGVRVARRARMMGNMAPLKTDDDDGDGRRAPAAGRPVAQPFAQRSGLPVCGPHDNRANTRNPTVFPSRFVRPCTFPAK